MTTLDVQLDWLRSFLAVADTGTFTAAARQVGRAQSRVSAHIASLEREFGAQLVVRNPAPVRLTPAGEVLLAHAQRTLDEIDSAQTSIGAMKGEVRGLLRVATFPGASAVLLAPVIRTFTEQYPLVEIELFDGLPFELAAMVLHNQVDFAVRTDHPPVKSASLKTSTLLKEAITVVVRSDHHLAELAAIDVGALHGERIVMTATPGDPTPHVAEVIPSKMHQAREVLVSQPTTVAAFANAGLGIGILPAMAGWQ